MVWAATMGLPLSLKSVGAVLGLEKQKTDITKFDEALIKKLIERITVFADHFTVEFKSGITININA